MKDTLIPIISLLDLLVAMVTTILIQSAFKHYVVNPLNQTILGILFDQRLTAVQNDIKMRKCGQRPELVYTISSSREPLSQVR